MTMASHSVLGSAQRSTFTFCRKERLQRRRRLLNATTVAQQNSRNALEDQRRRRLRFGDRPVRQQQVPQQQQQQAEKHHARHQQVQLAPGDLFQQVRQLTTAWNALWGQALYDYFNWRQDTSKDLQLIFTAFTTLLLAGGAIRRFGVDDDLERQAGGIWNDVYQVCQWVFGQEFPGPTSPVSQQVFAVLTAVVGLAAFALVLALVEQVVLEGMETNVKRGSHVYEAGHLLILGWCVSQRDLEVLRKMLQQICVAYKPEGGSTVVVLTQRSKLEMEGIFWRCLPAGQRHGTKLVFRQGSPLVPSDLKLVGSCRAAATVIISDQSRSAAEADAQAVRCAILLDELDSSCQTCADRAICSRCSRSAALAGAAAGAGSTGGPSVPAVLDRSLSGRHVVVELKTSNALPLLKYACSNRVIALPTNQLNAQRLAKMVKRPVISIVSQQLFNFENGVSIYVHCYPHLVGHHFAELAFLFPDGIVMGLVDTVTGQAMMAPDKDFIVQPSQALVICRPTGISSRQYSPLDHVPAVQELVHTYSNTCSLHGRDKTPAVSHLHTTVAPAMMTTLDGEWATAAAHGPSLVWHQGEAAAMTDGGSRTTVSSSRMMGSRVLSGSEGALLAAGQEERASLEDWSSIPSQVEALRQQVEAEISANDDSGEYRGSPTPEQQQLLLQNNIVSAGELSGRLSALSGRMVVASHNKSISASLCSQDVDVGVIRVDPPDNFLWRAPPAQLASSTGPAAAKDSSSSNSSGSQAGHNGFSSTDWPVLSGLPHDSKPWHLPGLLPHPKLQRLHDMARSAAAVAPRGGGDADRAAGGDPGLPAGLLGKMDASILVPAEYMQVDDGPEKVLVCGWGPHSLMADLVKELDHGLSALPAGSEVVFASTHNPDDSLGQVLHNVTLENITVRHVHANPLLRSSLAAKLNLASFRCCLCLCDELWVDPDSNESNGIDSLDEPSVLRLDSLVMVAQLNIRKLLEDSRLPPINIICQKVATEGLTRFEDRHRLPLGISVNLNSFAAKMLAQISANPLMLAPVTRLGEDAQLTIVDASEFARLGEAVNFWQLVVRCQEAGDVLLGYYHIPDHLDQPLDTVVDPLGLQERGAARVWNTGDGRLKFIVLRRKPTQGHHHSSSASIDDLELINTQQAQWVASRLRSPSRTAGSSDASEALAAGSSETSHL